MINTKEITRKPSKEHTQVWIDKRSHQLWLKRIVRKTNLCIVWINIYIYTFHEINGKGTRSTTNSDMWKAFGFDGSIYNRFGFDLQSDAHNNWDIVRPHEVNKQRKINSVERCFFGPSRNRITIHRNQLEEHTKGHLILFRLAVEITLHGWYCIRGAMKWRENKNILSFIIAFFWPLFFLTSK